MGINDLLQVLPAPANPRCTSPKPGDDWHKIEEKLGTLLPQDYKDFVTTYGSGYLGRFLWIVNPFVLEPNLNLIKAIPLFLDTLRQLRQRYGAQRYPYPCYPEPEGLLPLGATDNGDDLFWLTTGEPDEWPIVIKESRQPVFEKHPGPMTSFLAGIISGAINSEIISYDAIDQTDLFVPAGY